MVRLGEIILIHFPRLTDAAGLRGAKRRKEREEGEEHVLPASEAAENRLHQGEKINLLKIPPLPLVLTLHLSSPYCSLFLLLAHTHTICFYQHTLT